ncbi:MULTISPECIES: ribosome hibernation-promoting factor, HPF/YfiA family [Psychroflexus]|jgi:putative sigma-54 modulation protein|uniref:Sigma-54 modulation protein n=2 Tax=Psychroflexus TaxID=83612 RepID=A0ABP3VMY0_9FLAO|nr:MULTISPECIES: ribosome-associated translation inhibitor RaiA [Psychroflexus]MBZ9620003.1 ribosome-associated translation inhibitor RaiA [Psychroflexus lacisalsi]MBZ9779302.1 ribosome-associated translation inhibitor RaiA [Psychroflexus longus]
MDINFNYVHVTASERLEELISKKLNKLENRYDWIVRGEVFFKTENTSSPDTGMICEVKLSAPGQNVFASSNEKSFELAITNTIDDITRQLQKKKEKMSSR